MFNLGQICQNSEAKVRKPAYRHQPVLCSLIKHAVLANQSARDFGKVNVWCMFEEVEAREHVKKNKKIAIPVPLTIMITIKRKTL